MVNADGCVRLPMSFTEMQTELTGTVTVICGEVSALLAAVSTVTGRADGPGDPPRH